MASFGDRVVEAVARTGPLCAGIDPSPELLSAWGLPDDAEGLATFGLRCIEAFAGVVPVVKPQVAFFERHGAAGMAALEAVLAAARDARLLAIADAKRADISSTAAAYADAWLADTSPLRADAVTVTPYLGLGALAPLFEAARGTGRGVFVVVLSSNPEGQMIQGARVDGGTVADALLGELAGQNRDECATGAACLGSLGAVVGATVTAPAHALSEVNGVFLAPGVGAQGAGADEVAALFGGCPKGSVLPNVSRSVLAAGPSVRALADAARAVRDEMGRRTL